MTLDNNFKMRRGNLLGFTCLLLLALLNSSLALSVFSYVTPAEKTRFQELFSQEPSDLATLHYSARGLSLLKAPIPAEFCQLASKFISESASSFGPETFYHASGLSKLLPKCKLPEPATAQSAKAALSSIIKEGITIQDLYYAVLAQATFGLEVDSPTVSKLVSTILEKDDSLSNLGYSFHIASYLKGDLKPFFDRIEDAIVQADEINGIMLQFEGGLSITANVLLGAFKLSQAAKKPLPISTEQAIKFTNYLMSRKYVQAVKGASYLVHLLTLLTNNPFHVPLVVSLSGPTAISAVSSPEVQVQVTNVLGDAISSQPLTVVAERLVRDGDKQDALSKKPFTPVPSSPTTHYSMNLASAKLPRGFYTLVVSAKPPKPDSRLIGNTDIKLKIKVLTELDVSPVELSIEDRDDSLATKKKEVHYPQEISSPLEADFHQRLVFKFYLQDKQEGSRLAAHQVFVAFTPDQESGLSSDIVFVAEPDPTTALYKLDVDVLSKAKDFYHTSGTYQVSLIVGDATISNPIVWKLGSVKLTFPTQPSPVQPAPLSVAFYQPKPEIHHLFRPQDKRPPQALSTAFSLLVLSPWLILLVLWARVGVNLSGFPFSLSAIFFHLGLAAIFGLYACFWLQLNMFTTLKHLSWLGVFTFLSGHRLFTKLAASKK